MDLGGEVTEWVGTDLRDCGTFERVYLKDAG